MRFETEVDVFHRIFAVVGEGNFIKADAAGNIIGLVFTKFLHVFGMIAQNAVDAVNADGATSEFVKKSDNVVVIFLNFFKVADNQNESCNGEVPCKNFGDGNQINREAAKTEDGRDSNFAEIGVEATLFVGVCPEVEVMVEVVSKVLFHVETMDFLMTVDNLRKKTRNVVLVGIDKLVGFTAFTHMKSKEIEAEKGGGKNDETERNIDKY